MFGFSKKLTGIDIGPGVIRAVRVRLGGELPVIEGFAETPLPEGVLLPSYAKENVLDMKKFKETIQLALGTAGSTGGDISVSIPDQVVKVSFLDFKGVPQKREDVLKFIRWKAKRLLPYEPEAAKIDFQMMGDGDTAMTVFVKDEVVSGYETALSELSFRPTVVSTPSMSIFNLFARRFGSLTGSALIYVREDSFSVMIIREGFINFHRSKDIRFGDERFMQEIASTITFYTSENHDARIGKIYLDSAAGSVDGLKNELFDATGIDVEILRVAGSVEVPTGFFAEPYGAAIGAALYAV